MTRSASKACDEGLSPFSCSKPLMGKGPDLFARSASRRLVLEAGSLLASGKTVRVI